MTRQISLCTALVILLSACGHYGPPVRPKPDSEQPVGRESEAHPAAQKEKLPRDVQ